MFTEWQWWLFHIRRDVELHGRKGGNVLFNDALNRFYLRLYCVRYVVKNHSDSERGNLLPPHGLLFPISRKGSFIYTLPQTGQHIQRSLLLNGSTMKDRSDDPSHHELHRAPRTARRRVFMNTDVTLTGDRLGLQQLRCSII